MIDPIVNALKRRLTELERKAATAILDLVTLDGRIDTLELESATSESGSYTPTLTGMAVGTGGSATNSATYRYVGGPTIGDRGLITVGGTITFGTTTPTFPSANTISLPPGFEMTLSNALRIWGAAYAFSGGVDRQFSVFGTGATTTVRILQGGYTSVFANLSPTSPWTWASGDTMVWDVLAIPVTRV